MNLQLLSAPTNLGNRPYESDGTARHTDRGPARLREHGIVERLGARDLGDVAAAPYRDFVRPHRGVRNEDLVLDHVQRIARAIPREGFTLVLGGDCSTLLGCLLATGAEGLVFFDGHSDFNTPATSETGGVAGMDLALVTGRGDTPLARRFIEDEHVVTVGIRDVGDAKFRSATTADEILAHLGDRNFFIHVDADVLDPTYMPFVDSPEPGGLSPDELTSLLTPLVHHPRAVGMELTIYDPRDDHDGRGAKLLVDILANAFAT
ncbi:MAG TPA: arginase family protein [Thermoanaerobaculia bacterium]|jgi:arginase|nr:arginase family protein [Thermoanaerobaculia bacterium]